MLGQRKAYYRARIGGPETDAIARAERDPRVRAIEAQQLDLEKNWHPRPLFKQSEILDLINQCVKLLAEARKAVEGAPTNFVSDGVQMQRERLREIERRSLKAADYVTRAMRGKSQDDLIPVDDLKTFVIQCYRTASDAYVLSIVLWNHTIDTFAYLMSLEGQFKFLAFAAKKYAGHAADIVRTGLDYGKYLLIGGAGLVGAIVLGSLIGGRRS